MKKLVNRIDHVAWICELANIEAHVAEMERVLDIRLEHSVRPELGIVVYHNMAAGIEVVAPFAERSEANRSFHERLAAGGEGLMGVVFGVRSLDGHKARLEGMGYAIGDLIDQSHAPWRDKVVLRQRMVPSLINSMMVLGENDYADDMLQVEEV